ncbi:TlpA family protein disulfide reductase [Pedobacter rhizosphaerae]|uniref:Peroxiredoxin n=1 Tax=Pedobacter rhizosphaerae TaxID=390241 RepID=A0A1H9JB96_9SPHI|nr:TlpA disulfide reductase family protein [Pedobacter rhizosphaerae]SEQ84063.1 Peroxiredoxin [Pedobacter rhizosphaerae]
MRKYLFAFALFIYALSLKAQTAPVKWATQETFFEDLTGKKLPDFKGKTIKALPFTSKSLKDQIVLINFWFEKCPPCIKEMPILNQLVSKYGGKGIRFIAITNDPVLNARKFQQKAGYQYEVVCLTQAEISNLNINHGFPTNVLVGQDGKIIYATANFSLSDELPEVKAKTILFEEKLKAEITKAKK